MKELSAADRIIIVSLVAERDRIAKEFTEIVETLQGYVGGIAERYGISGQPNILQNDLGILCIDEGPVEAVEECQSKKIESEP